MMTQDNFKKKAIRERMSETGEPYSVAARKLGFKGLASWRELDNLMGGFQKGKLYIVASENGGGRTSFAINLLNKFSRIKGGHSLYINLELTDEEFMNRVNKTWNGITVSNSYLSTNSSNYAHSVEGIRKISQEMVDETNLTAIFVDYLQLLDRKSDLAVSAQFENDIEELKRIASELNFPMIVLSQVSHNSASPLVLNSLRGNLAPAADVILLVERDAKSSEKNKMKVNVTVAKNRQGATGATELTLTI
jgi:replicative DNA helicase